MSEAGFTVAGEEHAICPVIIIIIIITDVFDNFDHYDNDDEDDDGVVSGDALGWAVEPGDGQGHACRRHSCHPSKVLVDHHDDLNYAYSSKYDEHQTLPTLMIRPCC